MVKQLTVTLLRFMLLTSKHSWRAAEPPEIHVQALSVERALSCWQLYWAGGKDVALPRVLLSPVSVGLFLVQNRGERVPMLGTSCPGFLLKKLAHEALSNTCFDT